jgi:hypothetical protein
MFPRPHIIYLMSKRTAQSKADQLKRDEFLASLLESETEMKSGGGHRFASQTELLAAVIAEADRLDWAEASRERRHDHHRQPVRR